MTKKEAISIFKNERGVKVFPINTKLSIKEYYYKREKAIDMAIEALQFQDIMINNPQTAKPTPVVCKNCQENNRPKGKWIDIDIYYRMATCSHCHKVTMFEKWGEHIKPYDFCPNCGADMRGGDTE
jgi:hypothetical protein